MKPFEYIRSRTLQEASAYLADHPGAALPFAGGTDVLGTMKDRVVTPEALVNLKDFADLSGISYSTGEGLRIGALVTLTEIAGHPDIRKHFPVLAEAASEVASPQLRNAGTLGGNLCQRPRCWYFRGDFQCLKKGGDLCYAFNGENKRHCIVGGGPCYIVHPSDTAVALLTLDATVHVYNRGETREIPIAEFYVLPEEDLTQETVLKPGDLVTEITIPPLPKTARSTYIKVKERNVWDFALVSVGAVVDIAESQIRSATIAFGGVAPKPWQVNSLNRQLEGMAVDEDQFAEVAGNLFSDASPLEQNGYKIPLARNLVRHALRDLTA